MPEIIQWAVQPHLEDYIEIFIVENLEVFFFSDFVRERYELADNQSVKLSNSVAKVFVQDISRKESYDLKNRKRD